MAQKVGLPSAATYLDGKDCHYAMQEYDIRSTNYCLLIGRASWVGIKTTACDGTGVLPDL